MKYNLIIEPFDDTFNNVDIEFNDDGGSATRDGRVVAEFSNGITDHPVTMLSDRMTIECMDKHGELVTWNLLPAENILVVDRTTYKHGKHKSYAEMFRLFHDRDSALKHFDVLGGVSIGPSWKPGIANVTMSDVDVLMVVIEPDKN